jgi:ATP-dependent exoDNAse (exonuclease V) beta subunit
VNLKSFLANETPLVAGETLIEANAGTGKTYTLCKIIERLIVEESIPVERILAVTFTKSAAEELSERVRKNLKDRKSKLAQDAGSEHSMLARAISNFDEARISTLHAFCKRLLEDFAFECGVRTESDLQTDDTPLRKQVALDFRRATFLDCNPFLAAISFTGALTTENLQNRNDQKPSSELPEEQDLEQLCEDATEQYFSLVGLWKSELKEIESFLFQHSANGAASKKMF